MNKININECWKPVVGFEGLYEVSDMGRVKSLKYGKVKVLRPRDIGKGYLAVALYKDGKMKNFYVHALVITTFKGPIPVGMQVNHRNEDKRDNRLVNLEVVTPKENTNFGTRNERAGKAIAKANSKELKLTNAKTSAKYMFSSCVEASTFFGYKRKETIGNYIFKARQRNKNFIIIGGEKHYFSQEV